MKRIIFAIAVAALPFGIAGFATPSAKSHHSPNYSYVLSGNSCFSTRPLHFSTSTTTSLQMCICIHCARVTDCAAYHFVEEQHSQPHINKNPTWEPRNGSPTIQVHIRPDNDKQTEIELNKMWEEHKDQTRQAEVSAGIISTNDNNDDVGDFPLMGEKQYDLSGTTSYEYDVVECEDFTLEKDMWVRNMPEEIRLANPEFVPT